MRLEFRPTLLLPTRYPLLPMTDTHSPRFETVDPEPIRSSQVANDRQENLPFTYS